MSILKNRNIKFNFFLFALQDGGSNLKFVY